MDQVFPLDYGKATVLGWRHAAQYAVTVLLLLMLHMVVKSRGYGHGIADVVLLVLVVTSCAGALALCQYARNVKRRRLEGDVAIRGDSLVFYADGCLTTKDFVTITRLLRTRKGILIFEAGSLGYEKATLIDTRLQTDAREVYRAVKKAWEQHTLPSPAGQ